MALKQFQHNFNQEILNDRIKSMFDKICDYFYSKAAKSKLNEKETIEFITFTEQTTSKYLINTYLDNRTDSNNTKIDSLINKEQLIRANITYLKRRNQNKLSDSINQLVFDETLKLKAIDEKLKKSENRTALFFKNHFSFNKLDKHFIIQFKAIDSNMYRIVFNKGNVSVHKINDFINLRNKIINVVNQLKDISSSINDMNKDIAVVSNALLEGLNFSEITTSLNIIPDDVLHYLPFELLTKNGEHLLQDHNISYITSISFLNTPNVTINHPKEIALFAPSYQSFAPSGLQLAVRGEPYYLEGTIKEVDAISKLFDKPEVFLKDYATKSSFKGLPNDYNILHLSMHSFLNDQDSELSSLVFSDGTEDYELYISELYGLNLNANMAVLSACNTGVGDVKTGKGIVSMNTAFTAAGVPSVLSSLWSAPDIATQQIMTTFYKHLKNGEHKDLALKNAKLDYLNNTEDPNLRHPYYWAGFVLTGDTSPIILDNGVDWWIYIIGVLVVLVLLFIATKKRLKFN